MQRDAINAKTAPYLLSAAAQSLLPELASADLKADRLLSTLTRLRGQASPEEAGALVALARLRQRAVDKFPDAAQLYFVPEALEQATTWAVATARAERMHRLLPDGPILDLGCGIGGDLLALAQFRQVIAYEVDPVRALFAQANAAALGLDHRVDLRCADWTVALATDRLPDVVGAFADPARRAGGKRRFRLDEIEPPLDRLLALQEQVPALGIKVMPGVAVDELPPGCGVEFTGHDGVCKEAVLWFGPLRTHGRWASIQVGSDWHVIVAGADAGAPVGAIGPGDTLYEPHPALIRAGAFAELCQMLDAHLIDRDIAYLASPSTIDHPLVQPFRVLELHPFSLAQVNRRIQALGIGTIELKKRGFPIEPEQLRGRLKLVKGGRHAVLLIYRHAGGHQMILAERLVHGQGTVG